MSSRIHHPSCPSRQAPAASLSPLDARWAAESAPCICPPARARGAQLVEAVCFAALLGVLAGLPIYLLWRYTA